MNRLLWSILLTFVLPTVASSQDTIPFSGGAFSFGSAPGQTAKLQVSAELVGVAKNSLDLNVTVTLPADHYIYSSTSQSGIPTKITVTKADGFEVVGALRADRPHEIKTTGGEQAEVFHDKVTWSLRLNAVGQSLQPGTIVAGQVEGLYCSEHGSCIPIRPPLKFEATVPDNLQAAEPLQLPAFASTESAAQKSSPADSGASVHIVPQMRLNKGQEPPVDFTVSLTPSTPKGGEDVILSVKADVKRPYHIYSVTFVPSEFGGGTPTAIELTSVEGLQPLGSTEFVPDTPPETKPNPLEEGTIEYHHDSVVWSRKFVMVGDVAKINGTIAFQVCTDNGCLNPTEVAFAVATGSDAQQTPAIAELAADPSADQTTSFGGDGAANSELVPFIISAIGAGFLALLTPCVFPMIPITVSYFLKQGSDKPGSTLKLAVIYCLGIVGAFTFFGLLMAVLVGPTALNKLANNPWLNLAFAGIFTVFALMLMGMFEVRVPSWLLTWSSKNQESGGVVGVLFMALTFTLVSFTCTFAFVGSLLVLAAKGSFLMPIIGMIAFSSAFASPFFFLALFPSLLQRLPKSGGWMNTVKVTLGLLEMALVAKFLSVADNGLSPTATPQYLDFHLVIGCWIAIAAVTGMYLLSLFRMPHDTPNAEVGPLRCMFALGFFGLAAYMSVGLLAPEAPEGTLWQKISAFAPPRVNYVTSGEGYYTEHHGLRYALDFDAAVASASEANKPLFLDFTGMDCVNCREMEQTVLVQDEILSRLEGFERVQLYVDKVPGVKSDPVEHQRILERNQNLQMDWLNDVSIPAYVIASPDGAQIFAVFRGKDFSNGADFEKFLTVGVKQWEQQTSAQDNQSSAVSASTVTNVSYRPH